MLKVHGFKTTGFGPAVVPPHELKIQDALLQQPADSKGLLSQQQQLQGLFNGLTPAQAKPIQERLQANLPADTLAASFAKLPAATKADLNAILAKLNPVAPRPTASEPSASAAKNPRGSMTQQLNALQIRNKLGQQAAAAPAPQKSGFYSKVQDYLFPKETPGVYRPDSSKFKFDESKRKAILEGGGLKGGLPMGPKVPAGDIKAVGYSGPAKPVNTGSGRSSQAVLGRGLERQPRGLNLQQPIGPGFLTPYGTGITLSEKERYSSKAGELREGAVGKFGAVAAGGDTRFGQVRSRTYVSLNGGVGAEAQAALMNSNYGFKAQSPPVTLNGVKLLGVSSEVTVEALFVGAEGRAYAGADWKNGFPAVKVGAEGFVGARTTVRGDATVDVAGLDVSAGGYAQASAGATATAGATIGRGKDGGLAVEGSAGAHAGASVSAGGSLSVAGVGTAQRVAAWTGIGAKASGKASFGGGKTEVGFELGASLGIGGSVSVGVEINHGKVINNVATFGANTYKLLPTKAQAVISNAGQGAGKAAVVAANTTAKAASSAAQAVGGAAKKVFSGW